MYPLLCAVTPRVFAWCALPMFFTFLFFIAIFLSQFSPTNPRALLPAAVTSVTAVGCHARSHRCCWVACLLAIPAGLRGYIHTYIYSWYCSWCLGCSHFLSHFFVYRFRVLRSLVLEINRTYMCAYINWHNHALVLKINHTYMCACIHK